MGPLFCAEPVHAEPTRARRTPARLDMEQAPAEPRKAIQGSPTAPETPRHIAAARPDTRAPRQRCTDPPTPPDSDQDADPAQRHIFRVFPYRAVFSANPKTRYDARTSYSQKISAPFFQRSRKVAMMRARTTQNFLVPFFQRAENSAMMRARTTRKVFPAARKTRHDARASTPELPHGRFFSDFRNPL